LVIELASLAATTVAGRLIRGAELGDCVALEDMLSRCSLESRYGRFLGPIRSFPAGHLAAVTGHRPDVDAWVPVIGPDRVVGLASLHGRLEDLGRSGEIVVLVEDGWQRQGLGSQLLAALADRARHRGMRQLRAQILAEHPHVIRTLLRVVGPGRVDYSNGLAEVTITL
jgi:GNAT superfamily N-acetyltransferase